MKRWITVAALALALVGCGAGNTDPRQGRVTLDQSSCLVGDCYELYKFCIGPDLHTVYDEIGDDNFSRTDENSEECRP